MYRFSRALAIDRECELALRRLIVIALRSDDEETAQALLNRVPPEHRDDLRSQARSAHYVFRAPDAPPFAEPLSFAAGAAAGSTP